VIDFRYHLVSIVAVFLALAVGIVVGSTELRQVVVRSLQVVSAHEKKQIDSLLAQQRALKQQVSADEAFAQAAAPRLLPGLLTGQDVVIVDAPGADSQTISGVTSALQQAGAKITGQLSLQPPFFDTSGATEGRLSELAQQLAPAGLDLGSQTTDSKITGQETAAQVIAAAVITGGGHVWSAAQSQRILSGFGNPGYLQVSGAGAAGGTTLSGPATLAVVIIPSTPPASDTDPANLALVAFAQALQTAGHGTVVAGSLQGSGAGSVIDEILSTAGTQLTTVDNASQKSGQIAVAWALYFLLTGKKPASYGVGPGTFPSPAPSPASVAAADPTPATATPTPTASAHQAAAKRSRTRATGAR
jgi:Copper transport outer membrane protein, MctB